MSRSTTTSPQKKSSHNTPSPTSLKPKTPKKEWNSYLTDDDRFKVTKQELLRRKQLMISKHNILHDVIEDDQMTGTMTPSKLKMKSPTSVSKAAITPSNNEMTSLDLLTLESEHEEPTSDIEDAHEQPVHAETIHDKKTYIMTPSITPKKAKGKKKTSSSKSKASKTVAALKTRQQMIAEVMASTISDGSMNSDYDRDDQDEQDDDDFAYHLHQHFPRQQVDSFASPAARKVHTKSVSPKTSMVNSSTHSRRPFISHSDQMADRDIHEMGEEIKALLQEMKYYEELAGKKKIFDTEVS